MKNKNGFRKKKKYVPYKTINGIPARYVSRGHTFRKEEINMKMYVLFAFIVLAVFFFVYSIFWLILSFISLFFPFEVTFGKVFAAVFINEIMNFAFDPQKSINDLKSAFTTYKKLYQEQTKK